jgi:uncharacterized membrane protein
MKNGSESEVESQDNNLLQIYNKYTYQIWAAVIIIPVLIITIGCILHPEIFYDEFIWKYFWGPTVADADDKAYGDVTEGYNPVNTIVYGLILVGTLFGILKIIKKLQLKVDQGFIVAITPFVVMGATSRVMEDAELFSEPIVYLFIAPQIYIVIGLFVLVLFIFSAFLNRNYQNEKYMTGFIILIIVFAIINAIYILLYFGEDNGFTYLPNPIGSILFTMGILIWIYYDSRNAKRLKINSTLFGIGFLLLLITVLTLVQWQTVPEWTDVYLKAHPGADIKTYPMAFILIICLTVMLTAIVYTVTRFLSYKFDILKPYLLPINIFLFFGHFLDGFATFIAIDFYEYGEKHVLPSLMIDIFGTAAVMIVLKLFLILAVIYVIDILFKKDLKTSPTLVGLVKICVLILGLAPGIRDGVRLAMGL